MVPAPPKEKEVDRMKATLAVLAVVALAVTGCETFFSNDEESEALATLDYGGYTTESEAPAFGDEDLLTSYPDDQPYDDEVADNPQVRNALRNGGARHYTLRLLWGNLDNPDTTVGPGEDCPVTDWSGSLVVEGGVVIIKRLIRFDRGDYIVRPRRGPDSVEWVSHTVGHVDGILFTIIDTPDPQATETANVVRITTMQYSVEIPLADLEDYRDFIVIDDCNKISIVATETSPQICKRGFLEGKWISESDTSGVFKGIWIAADGSITGYLRGHYTIEDGNRVLYGKWITRSGRFAGLLRGRWMPLAEEPGPDGYFEGRWVDETFTLQGFFKGHYCICQDSTGFFHGRWARVCR